MRTRNSIWPKMAVLSVGTLTAGCGVVQNCTIGLLVGGADACVQASADFIFGHILERDPIEVMAEKLLPETWWLLLVAALAMYGILRRRETQSGISATGVIFVAVEALAVLWSSLSTVSAIIAIMAVLLFAGTISWFLKRFELIVAPIVWIKNSIMGAVKQVKKLDGGSAKGVDAEQKIGMADAGRFVVALVLGSSVMAVLLGGPWTAEPQGFSETWGMIIKGIGILLALAGVMQITYDWFHRGWPCPRCGQIVLDFGRNKPTCPYCNGFNPGVKWECHAIIDSNQCKHENPGTELECEVCGRPRRRRGKKS